MKTPAPRSVRSAGGSIRIGIVGAGAAGLFCAYHLERGATTPLEIDVFERAARFGGNTSSVGFVIPESSYATTLDAGAQFFFANPQPRYVELLKSIGGFGPHVARYPTGLCVWDRDANRRALFVPAQLKDFVSDTFSAKDLPPLVEFGLFLLAAEELDCRGDDHVSVADWLKRLPWLSRSFRERVVLPLLYQFVSLPLARIGEASARYAVTYLVRNVTGWPGALPHFPEPGHTFTTYQSRIGLDGLLSQLVMRLTRTRIAKGAGVTRVHYDAATSKPVLTVAGFTQHYDAVILACDPPSARQLLSGGTAQPDAIPILSRIEYQPLRIVVDDDPREMPADRDSWQAVNTVVSRARGRITFNAYFGALRPPHQGRPIQVFKHWGSPEVGADSQGSTVLADHVHQVLYPTVASLQARDALAPLQGRNGVWFAGGWTNWFDSQEAALRSALAVTEQLRPLIDPAGTGSSSAARARLSDAPRPATVRGWLAGVLRHLPGRARRRLALVLGSDF